VQGYTPKGGRQRRYKPLAVMNYKSGFRRVYVLGVACWVVYGITKAWEAEIFGPLVPPDPKEIFALLVIWLSRLVLPPAFAYFIFFGVIPWVLAGFRSKR